MYRLKQPWSLVDVMKPDPIPNGKTDTNNNGAFSTDYIGGNYDYPDGDYATRATIWQAHVDYIQGFFYFLAERSAGARRRCTTRWRLGPLQGRVHRHRPLAAPALRPRGRRMVGEYVDVAEGHPDRAHQARLIGMGSYNSDSHNVQRIVNADGFVENEGDMQVPVTPYQIPYRVMLPKRAEADEPARAGLLLGDARRVLDAAHGAAVHDHRPGGRRRGEDGDRREAAVQDVDRAALAAKLREQRAVFELTPASDSR